MGIEEKSPVFRLSLHGPFQIAGELGPIDVTSAKAIGLIALLACSPNMKRSRTWLQDRLWSDRGREQGAASLRQTLSLLRRALNVSNDVLVVDRKTVALQRVAVDIPAGDDTHGAEFLEGLDVRDPEFEDWLRLQRSSERPVLTLPRTSPVRTNDPGFRPVVYAHCEHGNHFEERLIGDVSLDYLSKNIKELVGLDVIRGRASPGRQPGFEIKVSTMVSDENTCFLRFAITDLAMEKLLWSDHRLEPTAAISGRDSIAFLELVFEATEAISDKLASVSQHQIDKMGADLSARIAIRKLFTMNSGEIADADAHLDLAYEIDPSPTFLAWKIQLRIIQLLERVASDERVVAEEIEALCAKAMALDSSNSMVLSAVSNAKIFLSDDFDTGVEFARRSLRVNSANPLGWDCVSIGLLMRGDFEEAHRYQLVARKLTEASPVRHFWDMGACLTSCVLGQNHQAKVLASAAATAAPDFRPPLRYLIALHAADGNAEKSSIYVDRLRSIEPDFSVARMVEDIDYPVAAMRRSGLLTNGAIRDLL